jgi:hypothetical protein
MPALRPEGGGGKPVHVRTSANDTTTVHGNHSFSTPEAAHNATSKTDVRSAIANSGTPMGIEASSKAQAPSDYHGMSAADTAMLAANFIPGELEVATAAKVGKYVAGKVASKLEPKAAEIVAKTFKQGKNAKIEVTPPKSTKAGPNSPVKGTKVSIETKTRPVSSLQQAAGARQKAAQTTKTTIKTGKLTGDAYLAGKYNERNKKGK